MKATRKSISQFLSSRKIAIAGVSRDQKKFGAVVMKELRQKGFDIYPVNPNCDTIHGDPCFQSVTMLPPDVRNLLILTPKKQTLQVVQEAVSRGIDNIWIQQMSDTREAIALLRQSKVNAITGQCILMWAEPVKSIHKFHRTVKKIFGMLPS